MNSQAVHASFNLVGDGTSTSFTFDLPRVYGLNFQGTQGLLVSTSPNPFEIINSSNIPDSVGAAFLGGGSGPIAASISSKGVVTLSFTPFTGESTVELALFFNG